MESSDEEDEDEEGEEEEGEKGEEEGEGKVEEKEEGGKGKNDFDEWNQVVDKRRGNKNAHMNKRERLDQGFNQQPFKVTPIEPVTINKEVEDVKQQANTEMKEEYDEDKIDNEEEGGEWITPENIHKHILGGDSDKKFLKAEEE